jgi:hypothetical protein
LHAAHLSDGVGNQEVLMAVESWKTDVSRTRERAPPKERRRGGRATRVRGLQIGREAPGRFFKITRCGVPSQHIPVTRAVNCRVTRAGIMPQQIHRRDVRSHASKALGRSLDRDRATLRSTYDSW